jgi:hypothetical protein
VAIIEAPRFNRCGFGHTHFALQQRVDLRIIGSERTALCVKPLARIDSQPLRLGQQQLPDGERLGSFGPGGGGIRRGVVLRFGGDGGGGISTPPTRTAARSITSSMA